jgi:diaminopropionate ammonia-lyase
MQEGFKLISRQPDAGTVPEYLSPATAAVVRRFHESFPQYAPTPLVQLSDTARQLGVGNIWVKDESKRFGLNAFKVLGGSYAMGKILAEKLGIPMDQASCGLLTAPETRERLGDITFITATDGNHGRGIAWSATQFRQKSVVYMPRGSARERLENIRAAGADASIIQGNYDDAVRLASRQAQEQGWILVQDTAWEGYEDIPRWIMEGYCTMGLEALEQLPEAPTHIFLQAGVGSMAGAMAGLFTAAFGEKKPVIAIVEPNKADCLYRTARADDGKLHFVTGDMDTIMAGLACGEPCSIAWEVLKTCADHFISCPDSAAAYGMRILGNPAGSDGRIISGESGASAFGCAASILTNPNLAGIKEKLGLDENSRLLFISTEGDTDQENYRKIVWEGAFPGTAGSR